jgi:hypothetical protein
MYARIRTALVATSALVVMAAGTPPTVADPGPSTHVDSVAATATGSSISVTGAATFVDVPVQIATDPSGDASPAGIGADLVSATIARPDPARNELKFRLAIGDSIPSVFTIPEVVHYSFFFGVGPEGADGQWLLQSLRTAQAQAAGSANPFFRLMQFRADGTCCDPRLPLLIGSMANGVVEYTVPMNRIGVTDGSRITAHPVGTRQIQIQLGASGQQWLNQGQPDFMTIENEYVVPGRQVQIGIAPAGTAPELVPLSGTATVNAAGAFTGSFGSPGPGSYVVVAKACYGPTNCGLSSTTLTI